MKRKIETRHAPEAIGTYSQAISVGNVVYCSGQIPLDPATMTLVSEDFKEQALQTLKNLQAVAKAAGGDLDHMVKLTIFLTDFQHFPTLNELMKQFFKEPYPARATIQVSALPKMAQIEIEGIMVI